MTVKLVEEVFTATGQSGSAELVGKFNVRLEGFGTASVQLERSIDGGITWDIAATAYTADALRVQMEEAERGIFYRFNCTSFTSGTGGPSNNGIEYRLSQ